MKNLTPNGKKILNYYSKSVLKSKIKDEEYDNLIKESLQGLYDISLKMVDLDPGDCISRSVMIQGPPNFKRLNGLEFKIKKGKDNLLRFLPLGITIYNFTDHSLTAYQCMFDPTTSNALNEATYEYFYNDIVSFETVTESGSLIDNDWKDKIIKKIPVLKSVIDTGKIIQYDDTQKFVLTTKGGTRLSVTLTEAILKEATDGGDVFSLSEAHKSISVVRRIVRDKKSYTHE
ncbi:hypothetical protein [Flavivirga algicola]|uniref:Uncharacterized protein n=1 Tax=Flavivirga algicola TaxID=2729136 RepID=A0ABX1RXX5_9FLAO|nr:hypothetical protein [Flavivirga algicola]NMH87981.1 hypothetical protein [Flavivirga algicola]